MARRVRSHLPAAQDNWVNSTLSCAKAAWLEGVSVRLLACTWLCVCLGMSFPLSQCLFVRLGQSQEHKGKPQEHNDKSKEDQRISRTVMNIV
jgi:hypothetical protein